MKRLLQALLLGLLALLALIFYLDFRREDRIHDAPPPAPTTGESVAAKSYPRCCAWTSEARPLEQQTPVHNGTMSLRSVVLPAEVPGSLWLAAMPGRFEPWSAFETEARKAGLALVVCLTPRSELAELSPTYHAAIDRRDAPYRWLNVPMQNFGMPDDVASFRREVQQIAAALQDGQAVLLHCAAGIGRTGSTAACVLKTLGLSTEDALRRVRDAGSNPETAQQSGLVEWF